ncbi:Serine/threonine-protein kinase VRK1 [Lamellibrachia satsuma]|nr:Serine/threonine-protein kinase VRK1 [Lamellibrachia satsuma]
MRVVDTKQTVTHGSGHFERCKLVQAVDNSFRQLTISQGFTQSRTHTSKMVKRKASERRQCGQSSSSEPSSSRSCQSHESGIVSSMERIVKLLRKTKERKKPYELADPLPEGEVMKDLTGNLWRLGTPFATGGFGLIYEAFSETNPRSNGTSYVIKLEPHSNGPLFCEMHFYQRVCKPSIIQKWMSENRLTTLGIPTYIGSGCFDKNSKRYRFMVMERFGSDMHKVFEQHGRRFSPKTAFTLALKLVDALEFIHENEYVHADIKGSNLLLGIKKGHTDDVYMVDFGLAYRYICDGKHKEYFEDKRRQHDGTIEYTSRDAHRGVMPSRRGDMEILGYCLLQWLSGKLPWESNLTDKNWVYEQKFKYMKNIQHLMKVCFPRDDGPAYLAQYLVYVNKLDYADRPDYNHVRCIFRNGLRELGLPDNGQLSLAQNKDVEVTVLLVSRMLWCIGSQLCSHISCLCPAACHMGTSRMNRLKQMTSDTDSGDEQPQQHRQSSRHRPPVSQSSVCPVPMKMPHAMKPPKTTPVQSRRNGVSPMSLKKGTSPRQKHLSSKKRKAVTCVAVQTSP